MLENAAVKIDVDTSNQVFSEREGVYASENNEAVMRRSLSGWRT